MRNDSESQLDRIQAAGAQDVFDVLLLIGAGAIGANAALQAGPCTKKMVIIDKDTVSATTTLLAPYTHGDVGQPKASVIEHCLAEKFVHLEQGTSVKGLAIAVQRLGSGFWKKAAGLGGVVALVALDDPASAAVASEHARRSGIPVVIATIGAEAAQVVALPPSIETACYRCLGVAGDPARPCLAAADGQSPPTVATPAAAATAAALAFALARQLLSGTLVRPVDVIIGLGNSGPSIMTAEIQRSAACGAHLSNRDSAPYVVSEKTTEHSWEQIAGSLGGGAVLLPPFLQAIPCGTPEAALPLRELGYEFWPVLECESEGTRAALELRGDAKVLGLETILEVKSNGAQ